MNASLSRQIVPLAAIFVLGSLTAAGQQAAPPAATEHDFVVKNFQFHSGESLQELHLHYTTLGQPARDPQGRVNNAVLILHGTGGSGHQFLQPIFAGELFGPGQILDAARYFIILPDGIGSGKSSKPSDGLHARFPQYDYDDMVLAHYRLLTEGLDVNHLRLVMGTSMGCMHSFVWGETYPGFMDALMPLACQPVQIAGRNRVWRKMVMDAIRNDPEWKGGEYSAEPKQALRTALDLLLIAGCGGQISGRIFCGADARARRQRFAVRAECFAELRSVAGAGENSRADDVCEFGGRFYQSAGAGDRGAGDSAGRGRAICGDTG